MKNAQKYILPFVMFILIGQKLNAFETRCWDGSFAYNTVFLTEQNDHVELSVMGSLMGPLVFEGLDDIITIGLWDHSTRLHIRFTQEECQNVEGQWECEKVARVGFGHRVRFFAERYVKDLDQDLRIVSPIEAKKIRAVLLPGSAFELRISEVNWRSEQEEQVVAFSARHCDEAIAPHLDDLEFPKRLKEFLDKPSE